MSVAKRHGRLLTATLALGLTAGCGGQTQIPLAEFPPPPQAPEPTEKMMDNMPAKGMTSQFNPVTGEPSQ